MKVSYCLVCAHAVPVDGSDEQMTCLLANRSLGDILMMAEIEPEFCPLPPEERQVPGLPKYGPTHPKRSEVRVIPPGKHDCFGVDYSHKMNCTTCSRHEECAEQWSRAQWNIHKVRGYGRGSGEAGNSWDDVVRVIEDEY